MRWIATETLSLLDALARLSPGSSKNTLRAWIKEGRIEVNEAPASTANDIVNEGDVVSLANKKKSIRHDLPILYEDEDIVVIHKPAGLLTVATAFEKEETAFALIKAHYRHKKVSVVHRLDQDTSGVMLFALSEYAYNKLKEMFAEHNLTRVYHAIVEGHLEDSEGSWRSYQYEDENYYVHNSQDPDKGRLAVTHYKVLDKQKHSSLLELTLETGRKNQIRAHCQAAGHPILGDKKYGGTRPAKRLHLHAFSLAFRHPVTQKPLSFMREAPFLHPKGAF